MFSIAINDVDEFDTGAVTDANGAANTVAENAAVGTTVGLTGLASDADATATISYSLDDNAGGRFAIHATTGVVTVNAALDYETATSHSVTIRATSSDGSSSTQSFSIAVTDVNESGITAISDTDGASDYVLENAANGTTVGLTAFADDPDGTDTVSYTLDDNAGGRFAIHATTGVVTVASGINREAAGSYDITVRATSSDTTTTTRTFTITIGDVDEFDVTAPSDSNGAANAVDENAANGTAVGITASATDADATTNTVIFSLTDNAGGRFAIDANTGVVTVANGSLLNREAAAAHNITVRATSADGSTADTTFTINVNDVDEFDVGAVSDTNAAANAVNENAANGTAVGITAAASDADATTNAITYSLQDNDGGRFAIDANTGIVTVAGAIDREADGASRNITVRATSADGSYTDQVFSIAINDVDEFDTGAVTDANGAANTVAENAAVGTTVGLTGLASDADATATITYSLDDNAGGRFAIHATTGVVTVNAALDYETATSHSVTIRATSSDGSYSTQSFSIAVTDVNESGITAISDTDGASDYVLENAANGTTVGLTAFADDPDGTDTVSYSLDDNAGGRFAIHATTGVVTVASGINREAAGSYDITVRATSSDTTTTTRTFTITIGDVDEFDVTAPSDNNGAANAVDENAANGTAVGITAAASRRRRHDQHGDLLAERRRRGPFCHRRQHGRGDRGQRQPAEPGSGRHAQHHGAGHLGRRLDGRHHVHDQRQRRRRVRRRRGERHQRRGQRGQRERRQRHDGRHHGRGQRRRRHDQRDHLQPPGQRRRTLCDRRQHGRRDRRRRDRPRSGRRQPQHHGPRHLGRRLLHRPGVFDRDQRRGRVRHRRGHGCQRRGQHGGRKRRGGHHGRPDRPGQRRRRHGHDQLLAGRQRGRACLPSTPPPAWSRSTPPSTTRRPPATRSRSAPPARTAPPRRRAFPLP